MGKEACPFKGPPGIDHPGVQIKNRGCLAATPAMGEVGRQAIGNNLSSYIEENNVSCQGESKIFSKIFSNFTIWEIWL